MKRETKGKMKAIVPFAFEVCGLETVSLAANASQIDINETQWAGLENYVNLYKSEYASNFNTTSDMCGASKFDIFDIDSSGNYIRY